MTIKEPLGSRHGSVVRCPPSMSSSWSVMRSMALPSGWYIPHLGCCS
jgi:hypothetical protein